MSPTDEALAYASPEIRTRREPRQKRSRERVEAILDAAAQIVVEHGIDAVAMRSISEESGIPVASIYQWFEDSDQIILALIDRDMALMDEQLANDIGALTVFDISTIVRTAITSFVTIHLRSPAFVATYLRSRGRTAINEYGRSHNQATARLLRDLVVDLGLCDPAFTYERAELAVEIGDRVLQLAFEKSFTPDWAMIEDGITMLVGFVQRHATALGLKGVPAA